MKVKSPVTQIPGVYHRKVGDIVVTAVSDGFLNGDVDVLINLDSKRAEEILAAAFRPARRTSVNCFLIFSGNRVALVDTGCGQYMGRTAGNLFQNLAAVGVMQTDIDTVLLTHLHPDHVGGLSDLETGTKHFPNAEIVVHEREMKYWHDSASQEAARGIQARFFKPAQSQLKPYSNAIRLVQTGEVLPGVHAVETPGHSPGHLAYLVESCGEQLIIWGDMIHVQEIQIPMPDVGIAFDSDVDMAADTRRRMFDRVASDKILVAGMHLHFPAYARLARAGDGYEVFQEAWVHNLRGTHI